MKDHGLRCDCGAFLKRYHFAPELEVDYKCPCCGRRYRATYTEYCPGNEETGEEAGWYVSGYEEVP
jgi:hypothetical protein